MHTDHGDRLDRVDIHTPAAPAAPTPPDPGSGTAEAPVEIGAFHALPVNTKRSLIEYARRSYAETRAHDAARQKAQDAYWELKRAANRDKAVKKLEADIAKTATLFEEGKKARKSVLKVQTDIKSLSESKKVLYLKHAIQIRVLIADPFFGSRPIVESKSSSKSPGPLRRELGVRLSVQVFYARVSP